MPPHLTVEKTDYSQHIRRIYLKPLDLRVGQNSPGLHSAPYEKAGDLTCAAGVNYHGSSKNLITRYFG